MQVEDLLEPEKLFKSTVKQMHRQNVEDYYDNLTKEAKTDIEANRKTVKEIKAKTNALNCQGKVLKRKKFFKGFCTFLIVVGYIVAVLLIVLAIVGDPGKGRLLKIIFGSISAVIATILIFVVVKLKKSIKRILGEVDELSKARSALISEAWGQMSSLNSSFEWNIPAMLFTKTIPLIQLDPCFEEEKYQMLHEKYDFVGNPEKNISSVFVQSGSILGNPFVIEKNYVQEMRDVTYTGSVTIHWTTTYTDSNGNTRTQSHTQTLTASVTKPAPYYYYDTMLVYGNDAAGNLSFSRVPSEANKMSDKQIQKLVDSYDSKLDKMTQKAISKGGNFQRLGNNEFEALFNALDRDNNIEFRLLFTPLAQKNMVNLIRSKEPYGDDFFFIKRKHLNYIKSLHSQDTNFEGSPSIFNRYYDYDESRKFFIEFNELFMQSLYYNLAPILSIPLYQQEASQEYIYKGVLTRNVAEMETEAMANAYDVSYFRPNDSETGVILKTGLISKQGLADVNSVYAYSFRTVEHIERITKLGGDGRTHEIPVKWIEYIPVSKVSQIVVQNPKATQKEYNENYQNQAFKDFLSRFTSNNDMIYKKGFISFLGLENLGSYNGTELNNIFKKGDK